MPAKQLVASALETALNALLSLDDYSVKRLQPLQEKRLTVILEEISWPVTFAFSDRIDVLMEQDAENADCVIKLQLPALNELRDSSQLTRLIQQGKLDLQGNIHVAQHFSVLIKELNIDWEEHLSHYAGDVAAYHMSKLAKQTGSKIKQGIQRFEQLLFEGAVEEKRLTPHPLEIEQHIEHIHQLRGKTGKLESRIASLESQPNPHRK